MIKAKLAITALLILALPLLSGCGHKLVAHNGESTVAVYPDKASFDKFAAMKSQGGASGMIGGLGESLLAKKLGADTPVKVLSSDDQGAQIEVTDGPSKGMQGYVAKDNLD